VVITDLGEQQHQAAVALWHATGLTRPWNDPHADLRRALDGPTSTVLAATEGGDLVGTAMVGHDGHRCWIYYLAVDPARQGAGIGRRLVEACERWARERQLPKIQLMVRNTNAPAVGFYRSLGYVDAETTVLGRFLS
jgi:ribosomal protein S18 acetylase RimI-like enzyme